MSGEVFYMNKIYISADIEGIWGNTNPSETRMGAPLYEEYRTNMIDEVNLVISYLFEQGVKEVVVNDGHGNMDNLLPSRLDPRASFISSNGAYKEYGMMEGLDASFDGVCLIGYHARSNTLGVIAHTIWGSIISKISVNGQVLGETGINAHLAHSYGVPVILVAGDQCLKKQASVELMENFEFVQTKEAINYECALCCSKNTLCARYEEAIGSALNKEYKVSKEASYFVDIEFHYIRHADFVSRMPGVERINEVTIRISGEDYIALYRLMRFIIKVSNAFE